MPVVFRYDGFRFFFYSDEGNPREPMHVHVRKGECEAKFWLTPDVQFAYSFGFNARTLRSLTKIIESNKEIMEGAWNEYFS